MDALVDLEIAELEIVMEQQGLEGNFASDFYAGEGTFTPEIFLSHGAQDTYTNNFDGFEEAWLDAVLAPETAGKDIAKLSFKIDDGGLTGPSSIFDILADDEDEIIVTGTKNGDPWTTSVSQEYLNTLGITIEEYLYGPDYNIADGVTGIQIQAEGGNSTTNIPEDEIIVTASVVTQDGVEYTLPDGFSVIEGINEHNPYMINQATGEVRMTPWWEYRAEHFNDDFDWTVFWATLLGIAGASVGGSAPAAFQAWTLPVGAGAAAVATMPDTDEEEP